MIRIGAWPKYSKIINFIKIIQKENKNLSKFTKETISVFGNMSFSLSINKLKEKIN